MRQGPLSGLLLVLALSWDLKDAKVAAGPGICGRLYYLMTTCMQGHQAPVPLLPAWEGGQAARAPQTISSQGWHSAGDHHTAPQQQPPGVEEEPH